MRRRSTLNCHMLTPGELWGIIGITAFLSSVVTVVGWISVWSFIII